MARKVVNRKALRAEVEAAEALGKATKATKATKSVKKPAAEKKKKTAAEKPAKEKKPAAKKAPRKKTVKEVRMKAYWGVFNQAMKRLVTFEYADKRAAEKKAAELGPNHFINLYKEPITE
jgi:nitrogen fixation protein FixH